MSGRDDQAPDPLEETLRDALGYRDTPDPETIEMIMTGYDIAGMDVVAAELIHDSALVADGVAVRDGEPDVRTMTAEGGGVRFEFEIRPEAPRIVGRLIPASPGAVHLDQLGNQQRQPLGESGGYEFTLLPGSPFRLRFVADDGTTIATDWVSPGPSLR
jgi:hypothetical protein